MDQENLKRALEWANDAVGSPYASDNARNAAAVLLELAGEIEAYRQAVSHVTEEPSADRSFTTQRWTMTSAQRHTDMLCEIERLKADNERMRKVVEASLKLDWKDIESRKRLNAALSAVEEKASDEDQIANDPPFPDGPAGWGDLKEDS